MLELAKQIKSALPEMSVVVVTNGYINPEPLEQILPTLTH